MSHPRRSVAVMAPRASHDLDVRSVEQSLLQSEQQMEGRCAASGLNVGRMIAIPGSDEWKIECPDCGALWFGGSTVLDVHDRPTRRNRVVPA